MKHIYLIYRESQSLQYGIGTYIAQLKMMLPASCSLTLVKLFADVLELSVNDEEGKVRIIKIPASACRDNENLTEDCGRNLAYILMQYINIWDELIFHFNYVQDYALLKYVKVLLPNAITVLTLHCLSWGLLLKGNWSKLQIMQEKMNTSISPEVREFKVHWEQEKIMVNAVDKVICLNETTRNFIHVEYGVPTDRIVVKPNVLLDTKSNGIKRLKTDYNFDESERIILYVGRIEEYKGVNFVIEAFRRLLQKTENIRLVIVGDGDVQYCLRQCTDICGKVTFTGCIEQEQLYGLYQIAEFGLLLSAMEQCSYVCIEMMMNRLPLIVTDVMGLDEMVEEDKNGFRISLLDSDKELVPDMDKLSTCMHRLLENEELRLRLSLGSREMYERKYKADSMVNWYNFKFK